MRRSGGACASLLRMRPHVSAEHPPTPTEGREAAIRPPPTSPPAIPPSHPTVSELRGASASSSSSAPRDTAGLQESGRGGCVRGALGGAAGRGRPRQRGGVGHGGARPRPLLLGVESEAALHDLFIAGLVLSVYLRFPFRALSLRPVVTRPACSHWLMDQLAMSISAITPRVSIYMVDVQGAQARKARLSRSRWQQAGVPGRAEDASTNSLISSP